MRHDIERWNAKYRNKEFDPTIDPDPLLRQYGHRLEPDALCLDLAGGTGHNGLYLCQLGCRCLIVDGSEVGLRLCRDKALHHDLHPYLVVADLDRFCLPESTFDALLVFFYINRALVSAIIDSVKPGGLLIYKTFNRLFLQRNPRFNPDYVLSPGELGEWFSALHCLDAGDSPQQEWASYWVGRK